MYGFLAGTLYSHRHREEGGFVVPHLVDSFNTRDIHLSPTVKYRVVLYCSAWLVAELVAGKRKVEFFIGGFV